MIGIDINFATTKIVYVNFHGESVSVPIMTKNEWCRRDGLVVKREGASTIMRQVNISIVGNNRIASSLYDSWNEIQGTNVTCNDKGFNELVEAEVLNSGKTVAAAQGQISQSIEDFEFCAGAIVTFGGSTNPMPNGFFNYTQKEPVGVCAYVGEKPLNVLGVK